MATAEATTGVPTEAAPGLARGLITVLAVVLGLNALWWIAADTQRALNFPYSFDFGEGILLTQAVRLRTGEGLYPDINAAPVPIPTEVAVTPSSVRYPPWFVDNYPPLYPWLVSWGTDASTVHPAFGRLLSFLGSLGIVVGIWFLGKRYAPRGSLWPVVLGLAWLATASAQRWGLVVRVDAVGIALALAGLLGVTCTTQLGRTSGLFFLIAAMLTKQSLVMAPASWIIAGLFGPERLRRVGEGIKLVLLTLAAVFLVGGVRLLQHTVGYTANEFSWARMAAGYGEFFALSLPLWGLYALGLSQRGVAAWADPDRRPWLLYPLLATLTVLTFGATGSDSNYYLEPLAALLAACAVLWAPVDVEDPALLEQSLPVPTVAVAAMLLAAFVLVGRWGQVGEFGLLRDFPGTRTGGDRIVAVLREVSGPVLSEDLLYTLRAGQRPDFQPYIFRLLAERGKWDEGPFVEQLRKGRYGAIALQSNLFEPGNREEPGQDPLGAGYDRFTPAMEEAIRSRYRLSNETPIFANGPWYLYVLR